MRKLLLLLTCLLMCCCSALALAAEKTKATDDPDAIQPMETISAAEMNERLQVGSSEDLLHVKSRKTGRGLSRSGNRPLFAQAADFNHAQYRNAALIYQ